MRRSELDWKILLRLRENHYKVVILILNVNLANQVVKLEIDGGYKNRLNHIGLTTKGFWVFIVDQIFFSIIK